MAKAYYGSRISAHIFETPEGYLVCKNVPIARTGVQDYRGSEFGADEPEQLYHVTRPQNEVFSPAAIASFEGKPVVDEHPDEDVTSENYNRYMKGVCRDVKKGEGDLAQFLVGDLVIYDQDLISKIKNGKREISCGYDCLWVPTADDAYEQREIRGNHIAVVDKGRAGHKVAIRDDAGRSKEMKSKNIFARMLAAFAKDANTTPDDLLEASQAVNNQDAAEPAPAPAPVEAPAPAAPAMDEAMEARFKAIEDAIAKLTPQPAPEPEPEPEEEEPDALDALEEELTAEEEIPEETEDEDPEAEVEADPELINAEAGVEDEEPEAGCLPGQGRDAALQAIRNLKPVVARLPESQRKKAADSLAMLIRGQLGKDAQYGSLVEAKMASKPAKDTAISDEDLGRYIRDKYNTHYKK